MWEVQLLHLVRYNIQVFRVRIVTEISPCELSRLFFKNYIAYPIAMSSLFWSLFWKGPNDQITFKDL